MRTIHILNPAAGKGEIEKYLSVPEIKNNSYITTGVRDAERFAEEEARKEPFTRFTVYGGDGTANEVLNGIMKSGSNGSAQLKIVPTGTGNDFIKNFGEPDRDKVIKTDIIKYNDRYALNIINFGFDCGVVVKTQKYKKLRGVSGSFAYILGVADMLLHKLGAEFTFEYEDANGGVFTRSEVCTLCAVANGRYYGGGFMAAPVADLHDGLLDLMTVKKVTRAQFISLVGDYKAGRHIDPVTLEPKEKFKKYISYVRCRKIKITGLDTVCADGEIEKISEAEIVPVKDAINYVY